MKLNHSTDLNTLELLQFAASFSALVAGALFAATFLALIVMQFLGHQ